MGKRINIKSYYYYFLISGQYKNGYSVAYNPTDERASVNKFLTRVLLDPCQQVPVGKLSGSLEGAWHPACYGYNSPYVALGGLDSTDVLRGYNQQRIHSTHRIRGTTSDHSNAK